MLECLRYVPLGQLEKSKNVKRKAKVLKKPRADDRSSKNTKISKSNFFMQKAQSRGQTYVCSGLNKPSLGINIGTSVPM